MATPPPRRSAMITREGAGMVSLLVIASGCGELDGDDEGARGPWRYARVVL